MIDLRTPHRNDGDYPDEGKNRSATIDKIVDATNATLRERVIAIYTYGSNFGRPRPHPPLRLLILIAVIDRIDEEPVSSS